MERRRVLPDVNVCFPISLLDLVLRLDEADLHQVIWTEDLLDELTRVWVEHGARSAEGTLDATPSMPLRSGPDTGPSRRCGARRRSSCDLRNYATA